MTSQTSMLLSLDAKKAFDRVDQVNFQQVLVSMGFGDKFVKWIPLLYQDPKSRVRVKRYCSRGALESSDM